jgi:hypothetical protein
MDRPHFGYCFGSGRRRIDYIKNRGTNKYGKEKRNKIHTYTEHQGLPSANGEKGFWFHGLRIFYFQGYDLVLLTET